MLESGTPSRTTKAPTSVPVLSTIEGLKVLARNQPVISPHSFLGREHMALYSERLDKRFSVAMKVFGALIRPPLIPEDEPPHIRRKQNWDEFFPGGNIDVRPRDEAGLEPIPSKFATMSWGTIRNPLNTHAIMVGSVFTISETPAVIERMDSMTPKSIELLSGLVELARVDIAQATAQD